MLIINTYLHISKERVVGLYANEPLYRGAKYWIRNENFDSVFTPYELDLFNKITIEYIKSYGFLEKTGMKRTLFESNTQDRDTLHKHIQAYCH